MARAWIGIVAVLSLLVLCRSAAGGPVRVYGAVQAAWLAPPVAVVLLIIGWAAGIR